MKKFVTVTEVEGEGLTALGGERITLFCLNYFYTGVLSGVNDEWILLTDASIVYETGPLNTPTWADAQALPHPVYVMKRCIESFMVLK